MKKLLFISFLLSCTTLILQAQKIQLNSNSKQIQTNKPLQPVTQQPSKVNNQTRTNANASAQVNKFKAFPVVEKAHFLKFYKSLTRPGARPRVLAANKPTYFNIGTKNFTSQSARLKNPNNSPSMNVMDQTIATGPNKNKPNFQTQKNNVQNMEELLFVASKNFSDGHKATYILTSNTANWANNFGFSKNVKASQPDNSDPSWNCNYVTQTLNAQSSSFMNAAVNQNGTSLIPGTIYTFDDYAKGTFNEFKDGRNPIIVWTPTTAGQQSQTIQNPSQRSISQGISNIVSQFAPDQGGGRAVEQIIYSDNQSDLNILVSAGGSYAGFSGFAITKQNQSQHHIYVTYDAIKLLYTIKADRPDSGFFANGKIPVTSSPLVMIQNVTYGTRILANIDIQTTANTNYDSLHLNYTDGADQGTVDFSMLANDKSLSFTGNIYVVGTTTKIPIISLQNFQQELSDLFSQSNFRTALPIQYELSDLDGNTLGVESMTDQFTIPECTPAKDIYTLKDGYIKFVTGQDGKNSNSQVNFSLYSNSNISKGSIGFSDNSTEFKSGNISIPYKLTNPSAPLTLDDFADGGLAEFTFMFHPTADPFYMGDDWDITSATVTLYFVSQKGNTKPITIKLPNFRLSSHLNGTDSDLKFYFNSDGSLKGG